MFRRRSSSSSGEIRTYGTARRLALVVTGLAARQTDREDEVMGPAARAAWDAQGEPTKALLGFCQGKGVRLEDVRRVQTPKGEYVAVTVHQAGKAALEVLPAWLAGLALGLAFPKTMRWLDDETRFARPVRWLVALLGHELVPVRAFGLEAGRHSRGHRFLAPGPVEIPDAQGYLGALERAKVVGDHRARRRSIQHELLRAGEIAHGTVREDDELLDLNNFMVEWPTAIVGSFDPRFHELPNEVIITALREHQLFFAVQVGGGPGDAALRDKFVAIRNGDDRNVDAVRKGNEDVLTARLEDAEFYWKTDHKKTPAQMVDALASVVWLEGLGSLRDKAARLQSLGAWLAERLAPAQREAVERAALLCKTDLLSEMIGSGKEYASLQGIIGSYYARDAGEPEPVYSAIYDHYRPRGASDKLPRTEAAIVLSLADKVDHAAGAFVAGKAPSGSEDPYGVRRAANGVVRILIESDLHLDLRDASMQATAPFFAANPDLPQAELRRSRGGARSPAGPQRRRFASAGMDRSRGWPAARACARRIPRRPPLRAARHPVQARRQHPQGGPGADPAGPRPRTADRGRRARAALGARARSRRHRQSLGAARLPRHSTGAAGARAADPRVLRAGAGQRRGHANAAQPPAPARGGARAVPARLGPGARGGRGRESLIRGGPRRRSGRPPRGFRAPCP